MRIVDLFAGCGGMTLGFMKRGFKLVAGFESWDTAIDCHRKNFAHPILKQDLSNVDESVAKIKAFHPDIIIGGPPCQDFSNAGKHVEAERANLTICFSQIISRICPQCFVMENVSQAQKSNAYYRAREIFKEAGYGLTEVVLDASLCGVPQKRRRFFCFGMLGREDGFAKETFTNRLAKRPMTVRSYFGNSLDIEYYYRHPRTYSQRAVYSIDEPSATIRGVNCNVPRNYYRHSHPNDACPVTSELRSLTYRERAKIQTFPDDFKWIGKRTDIETMIGNAVPVRLASFVADVVRATMTADSSNIGETKLSSIT